MDPSDLLDDYLRDYGTHSYELPDIAGKYAGRAVIVCGDAACVWEDLEKLGCRVDKGQGRVDGKGFYDFMTVNKLVEVFPGNIEHAYSNEPHLLEKFIAARRQEYAREFEGPKHTHSCNRGAQHKWPLGGHATSGLGATLCCVGMGYAPIILAGIPLDAGPHNGEPPWRKCGFLSEAADSADGMNRHWKRARDLAFRGKVRSMSGRTRQWLGAPR